MALDSITLYHLIRELHPDLVGTRIDKIHQPEKEEIHLLLRSGGRSQRLLLNSGAGSARIHLTEENKKNPSSPPMFCMILRKHLDGGKITDIRQVGLERIVTIIIENYNERGDLQEFHLHLEIMGKHSNLILVDPLSNTILDGIKRYSHALSRHREVLPGRQYIAPPSQNKVELTHNEDKWISILLKQNLARRVSDLLVSVFDGISPELAREMVLRAQLDPNATLDNCGDIDLSRLFQAYSLFLLNKENASLNPCLYYQPGSGKKLPAAFTFTPYEQYAGLEVERTSSLNEAVCLFFRKKAEFNNTEAKRGSLRKIVQEHYEHLAKKLNIYEDSIAKAKKGLHYKKTGELLTANLYRIPPGISEITVEDYTDPDFKPVTVKLDPALSGIENAQRYFKLYNKSKATIQKTEPLRSQALEEMNYLQTLLVSIDQASDYDELTEIHNELIEQNYLARNQPDKKSAQKKKRPEDKQSRPHVYYSRTGRKIIVGRNNKQNDRMTWREAKPTDLWLHVKETPGSHVIIPLKDNEEFPDDETLLDAATLAVYFSQARGSSHVPVDYTHVKQIKKPKGAKPGMVVYEQNWSLFITPDQETIERLLASETSE